MDTTNTLTDAFKTYLEQLGYSQSSCNMLPGCVRTCLEHLGIAHPRELTKDRLLSFYDWLHTKPAKNRKGALSEMMIYHYMYSLRVFMNWLEQTGRITKNPMSALQLRSPQSNPRLPLDSIMIRQLLHDCETIGEEVLLHLFYSCGLRRSEAARLDIRDVSLTEHCIYVRSGKGARRRCVPFTPAVKKVFARYVRQCRPGAVPKEAFMVSSKGRRMSGNGYYRMLKRMLRKGWYSDLADTVSLHHLRHSIGTHLLANGLSVEFVRDFLGHKHLEATQIYTHVPEMAVPSLSAATTTP